MKTCKTCKHLKVSLAARIFLSPELGWMCSRGNKIDPLSGKPLDSFCNIERTYSSLCGKEGRYWEPK